MIVLQPNVTMPKYASRSRRHSAPMPRPASAGRSGPRKRATAGGTPSRVARRMEPYGPRPRKGAWPRECWPEWAARFHDCAEIAKMKTKLSTCSTNSSRTAARKASAPASISAATTSSRRRRRAQARTASPLRAFAEEPLRAGQEHEDQEDEGGRVAPGAAQEEGGRALDAAVEEPADDRAAHAAEPAEDDDGERLDGRQRARVGAEGVDDAVERAGEGAERGADSEGQHVHALDADAHEHRGDPVLARRAHVPPEARPMEHHPEPGDDRPGQHEQDDEVVAQDRKSTRLNSSHGYISYA